MRMRKEMSSLDLFFLEKELKFLEGGIIQKIYQKGKALRIEVFISGKGAFELYFEPGKIFITEYKRSFPEPTSFCMFLRKHLNKQKIISIRQYDFERIIELETQKNILIFELFSKGNVIICDKAYNILMPLGIQLWKHRKIIPKEHYKYPPQVLNPFKIDMYSLKKMLKNEKNIVSFLATNLSLSGFYAEEVCLRANIDKNKACDKLIEDEILRLYEAIHSLLKNFNPQLIFDKKIIDFSPIDTKLYEGKEIKLSKTFMHVIDEFFSGETKETEEEKKFKNQLKRLEKIRDKQLEKINTFRKIEKENRKKAEAIYNNFELINKIISGLKKAKESMTWNEIKKRIKDTPESKKIKTIQEKKGIIILDLETEVEIDFRKTAQRNAERYFQKAKKAKQKIEPAIKAKEKTITQIKKLEKEELLLEEKEEKLVKRRRGKWYEKFRWFFTTENFFVIAGRDATQNDIIFKKHLEKNDIVLHADITGAPLTIIKSDRKRITPLAIREAAEFAAAYSSAWKKFATIDVYWIKPEQISKTPPSGEYLPKGSFMIRGKKNYLKKIELKIAIGIKFEKNQVSVISGNVQSVRKHARYFVTIIPGNISQQELAKQIKLKILQKAIPEDKEVIEEIILEDIQRLIPAGTGNVIE